MGFYHSLLKNKIFINKCKLYIYKKSDMRFKKNSQTSKFAQKYIVFMSCSGHWELKPKYLRRFTIVEFFRDLFIFLSKRLHRWEATSSLGPSHKLLFYVLCLWWLSCLFCLRWDGWGGSRHVLTWHCWVLGERGGWEVRGDEEGRFTICPTLVLY